MEIIRESESCVVIKADGKKITIYSYGESLTIEDGGKDITDTVPLIDD